MTQDNHYDYGEPTNVRRGSYLMINDFPCKVVQIAHFKPGKHGSAKYRFDGVDIFTDKKCVQTFSANDQIRIPIINKNRYQLINIEDIFLSLLDDVGDVREDINLPEDPILRNKIVQAFDDGKLISLTVISANSNNHRVIELIEERD